MARDLEKDIFDYKESRDDQEIPRILEGAILEAWQSFSVVERSVNYFGFGNEENWLNNFDKLLEKYYEEYLDIHRQLEQGIMLNDEGIIESFYIWLNSSA
jgi:hypothetical protein